jgi:hypothetical protein
MQLRACDFSSSRFVSQFDKSVDSEPILVFGGTNQLMVIPIKQWVTINGVAKPTTPI